MGIVKLFINTEDTDFIKLIVPMGKADRPEWDKQYLEKIGFQVTYEKNKSKGQGLRMNFEIVNV